MPVDPEISLAAKVPQSNGLALDTLGKFAEVQNQLNQSKLFQQTFAARQAAGQIMATAPDMESAARELQRNPITSAFAPELVQNAFGNLSTFTAYQGEVQRQSRDGFDAFMKSLPAVMADPSQWGAVVSANLATLSPQARERAAPAMEAIKKGLLSELPEDPAAAQPIFQRRLTGLALGGGVTPEIINGVLGTPTEVNTGGRVQFGTRAPAQGTPETAGGGFRPAGNSLEMSMPPQVLNVPKPTGSSAPTIIHDSAGSSGTELGRTPTTIEAGENLSSAETAKTLTSEANTITTAIPARIKTLDTIESTLKQFQSGGGTPTRGALASMAQALKNVGVGITDEEVDKIASGSISALQLFDTQLKPLLTNMLTHDAAGQGRVMLPEVDAYMHLLDTAKDPRTIVKALNNIRYMYQVGYDKSQKWQEYKSQGKDPSDFSRWYDAQLDPKALPQRVGSLRFSPLDPAEVLGGSGKKRRSIEDIMREGRGR